MSTKTGVAPINDIISVVAKNEKLPSVTLSETENPKNDDNKSLIELLMQQTKRTDQALELLKESIQTNSKMMPKIGNNILLKKIIIIIIQFL